MGPLISPSTKLIFLWMCVWFIYFLNLILLFVGTIEERIFQRQVSKQGLSGTVVDLGKGAEHTSFSTSELRDLFTLTDTPCITHDLLNCSCSMDGSVQGILRNDAWHIDARVLPRWTHHSLFFFYSQLPDKWRSRFLTGAASSVDMATAGGRRRNHLACLSWCSGDISLVTRPPSQTHTSTTHGTISPSPSRPPSLTQLSKHNTLDKMTHTHFSLYVFYVWFCRFSGLYITCFHQQDYGSNQFSRFFQVSSGILLKDLLIYS